MTQLVRSPPVQLLVWPVPVVPGHIQAEFGSHLPKLQGNRGDAQGLGLHRSDETLDQAMLPCLPTAPKQGLIRFLPHQVLKVSHQNCRPLSETMYFGVYSTLAMGLPRREWTCTEVGCLVNTANPTTHLEK